MARKDNAAKLRICLLGLLLAMGCSQRPAAETASASAPPMTAGADMGGSAEGDGEAGMPPSTHSTLQAEYPMLDSDEHSALAEFDELFETYASGEGASGLQFSISNQVDCEGAAELRDRICELAERICRIYEEHPEPAVGDRCQRGTRGCEEAQDRVSERCG